MKTTIRNKWEHLESYPCLTFVWKTLLFWNPSQHKREELHCLAPHEPSLSRFAGEKHVFRHLSFPTCVAFYLMCLFLWWGAVQGPCWYSSLICFWPCREDRTRIKWVNPELGGLHWKGTTGKKFRLSFTTFCLKHMGRIRSYILILMSWDLGACLEIYARAWIWFETILCCAYTSSIFLWFSPLWSTGDGCRQDPEKVVDSVDLIVSRELDWRKSKTQISFLQEDCCVEGIMKARWQNVAGLGSSNLWNAGYLSPTFDSQGSSSMGNL